MLNYWLSKGVQNIFLYFRMAIPVPQHDNILNGFIKHKSDKVVEMTEKKEKKKEKLNNPLTKVCFFFPIN